VGKEYKKYGGRGSKKLLQRRGKGVDVKERIKNINKK
jgi:hypothetical protein